MKTRRLPDGTYLPANPADWLCTPKTKIATLDVDLATVEKRVLATLGNKIELPPGEGKRVRVQRFKINNDTMPGLGPLPKFPSFEEWKAAGESMGMSQTNSTQPEPAAPKKDERMVVRDHIGYLSAMFDSPDNLIKRFRRRMRTVDFDTLVGIGTSGTLAAQLFATAIGCHYAIVRKDGVSCHSDRTVEGNVGRRWVFVDDLICSGATRERVLAAMEQFCQKHNWDATYVGDYMYNYDTYYNREKDIPL